jgi:formylglycine-generating enzyme required for sulfatase activity
VDGGTYDRTYTNDGGADGGATGLADPATVSGFRLDKYLVTVGRFRQFVNAWNGGWTPAAGAGRHAHLNSGSGLNVTGGGYEPGWSTADNGNIAPTAANLACNATYATWTATAGSVAAENLPINCVNWYEAYAFCIWDSGFLPSEAEWEYAAAGGNQQREYPWGETAPGTACPGTGCQYVIYGCNYPSGAGSCTGVTNIAPVGTAKLGAGLWSQLDLAGDMWEWTVDWNNTYVNPCSDCVNLTSNYNRVVRGGYFFGGASYLPASYRAASSPTGRVDSLGFRCARTP